MLCYKSGLPPKKFSFDATSEIRIKVRDLVNRLRERIREAVELLCCHTREEREEEVIEYIDREFKGKTFDERLDNYLDMFEKEVEANAVAEKYADTPEEKAKSNLLMYLNKPYENPRFKEAVKEKGFTAERIITGGLALGVGLSVTAAYNLQLLAGQTIADTWMHFYKEEAKEKNAIGFYAFRGSSYPCDICDDYTGFHEMDDYQLPLHPHCCCYAVFIYND